MVFPLSRLELVAARKLARSTKRHGVNRRRPFNRKTISQWNTRRVATLRYPSLTQQEFAKREGGILPTSSSVSNPALLKGPFRDVHEQRPIESKCASTSETGISPGPKKETVFGSNMMV